MPRAVVHFKMPPGRVVIFPRLRTLTLSDVTFPVGQQVDGFLILTVHSCIVAVEMEILILKATATEQTDYTGNDKLSSLH